MTLWLLGVEGGRQSAALSQFPVLRGERAEEEEQVWGRHNDHLRLGFMSVCGHLGADTWGMIGNVVQTH